KDLELIRECLMATGFETYARKGLLDRILVRARTFGFHMAALDVRQHSAVHEEAVSALFRVAEVHPDYAGLGEQEKLDLLATELANPRPLTPREAELPEAARTVLEGFQVIREIVSEEPLAVGSYIISMTHAVSDMLE